MDVWLSNGIWQYSKRSLIVHLEGIQCYYVLCYGWNFIPSPWWDLVWLEFSLGMSLLSHHWDFRCIPTLIHLKNTASLYSIKSFAFYATFCHSFHNDPWDLGGAYRCPFDGWTFSVDYFLYLASFWFTGLNIMFCKQKLLSWELRDALICESLGSRLTVCSLSRIILMCFPTCLLTE